MYRSSIDLDGIPLPEELKHVAEESIGAATQIARQLPQGGAELVARAGTAFTDAFVVTSRVAGAIALVAAFAVYRSFSHKSELAAAARNSEIPAES